MNRDGKKGKNMKKLGIVVAQEKECENLFPKLGKCEVIDLYAGLSVKKFIYADKEIYFAESGIGEIRAAIAVRTLVDEFKVDAVLNFGVAGGLEVGTRGNIYVIDGVCHYDFDITPADGSGRGKYEIFDSAVIKTDERLTEIAHSLRPSSQKAVCASGDKFVVDPAFKADLIKDFGATVCEMEAAGVLIAAKSSSVPCAIIKIVSDDSAADEYHDFLADMTDELNELVVRFIEKI